MNLVSAVVGGPTVGAIIAILAEGLRIYFGTHAGTAQKNFLEVGVRRFQRIR
jgi:hypothetical protein